VRFSEVDRSIRAAHVHDVCHHHGALGFQACSQTLRLLCVSRSGTEYACIQGLGLFAGLTDKGAIAATIS
jgi:hypothetical protein